ncbi:hypothetical protein FE257_001903 [Aspergillus nanangensis]|uniref:DUF952 domain-containing protein n=1 Tax=Aspergillus nanangensis TaxID=2582783 RepID=A0AAD4CD69_ASPNN|nr:hypothetical protein FE257_001903 [Aspergillus nanangensis]
MTDIQPLYVYKLVPSTAPVREPLPDQLPVSEIDEKSGFIHLSTAFQIPNTLNFFFQDEPLVYILRIPYARVVHDIRWETPDGTHLYNGLRLGKEQIESFSIWSNENGWEKALEAAKPWLLY